MQLELRPFLQSQSSTCLPTCLRIALHYFGLEQSEEQLAVACNTTPEGTSIKDAAHAMRLQGLEVITLKEADLFELVDCVSNNRPAIAALDVEHLPYGKSGAHAVVVCGFEKNEVLYIDPGLGREMSLDLLTFFKAWESLGRAGLVIYPKSGL